MATQRLTMQQALEEAHRCLLCHDAPCSKGCPAGTDPAKFIRQIRFYNFKGAARTVLRNNPLGGVCGCVCPTEETCVRECLRSGLDRPIDIDALQLFAVEYGRNHGVRALQPATDKRPEKIAVVGGGPAGLTAAARLAQHGYGVTLFEQRPSVGGMLRYGVPPSRLSESELEADLKEIFDLEIDVRCNTPIDGPDGAAELVKQGYAAVFVAPGLWQGVKLDLPGIDSAGVSDALTFLAQVHTDKSAASALVEGKRVVIIGGGSVAMDVALCAKELGAKRIYAIALEGFDELPANADELHQALADGILIRAQSQLTRIVGDGKVSGVEGVEIEWIEPNKLTPDNARQLEGTRFALAADAVIQAVGQRATNRAGKIIASAEVDETTGATSQQGVYAGGDLVRGAGTVVAAVGDGKRAADAIHELIQGEVSK